MQSITREYVFSAITEATLTVTLMNILCKVIGVLAACITICLVIVYPFRFRTGNLKPGYEIDWQ